MSETGCDEYHHPMWYVAAILGGLIGGVIAFFALRGDAPNMSKFCLLISIISEIVGLFVVDALGFDCAAIFTF